MSDEALPPSDPGPPAPRRAGSEAYRGGETPYDPGEGPTSYAKGWGDGVREALHYVQRLVGRGHTSAEVRVFIESRLGHLDEEIALKRRTLLSSPTGIPVESLVRVHPKGSTQRPTFPPALPGYNYLFLEETRDVARAFLRELLPRVGRTLAITRLPSDVRRVGGPQELVILHLGVETSSEEGVEAAESSPNAFTGRIESFLAKTPPPALIYLDAFEYLTTQNGFEITMRFAYWLHNRIQSHHGVLIVSVDPESMSRAQVATLERDFNHVVRAG